MSPESIIKTEFKEQIEGCLDMMATAPDFTCCLITLIVTKDAINSMLRTTADAIKFACPDLVQEMEDTLKHTKGERT